MSERSGRNQRRLKNILISPKYQLKWVVLSVGVGIALTISNAAVFYRFVSENYAILVDLSPMTDEAKNQLYQELNTVLVVLGTSSLIFVLVVGALALLASHRSAGPLYHFRRVFDEIRSGNRNARIRLRPTDDFHDVATSFNQMMDTIHSEEKPKQP